MKINGFVVSVSLLGVGALASGCVERRVAYVPYNPPQPVYVAQQPPPPQQPMVVQSAPPPPRVETVVVAPGPDYIWMPGYWSWNGRWVWMGGAWGHRPRPGVIWVGPRWESHGHGYMYRGGHWR